MTNLIFKKLCNLNPQVKTSKVTRENKTILIDCNGMIFNTIHGIVDKNIFLEYPKAKCINIIFKNGKTKVVDNERYKA